MTVWQRLTGEAESSGDRREDYAGRLAQGLLNIFAMSLGVSFVVMGGLLAGAIYRPNATMVAVVPTLKEGLEILRLSGSLFSPLLAFVLGYYFNQSTRTAAEAAGAKAGAEAGAAAGGEKGAATGAEAGKNVLSQTIANVADTDLAKAAGAAAGATAGREAGKEAGAAAGATAGKEAGKTAGEAAGGQSSPTTTTGQDTDNPAAAADAPDTRE
jgi:hypothetical protein